MQSYDLSNHDLLKREVARLPLQAQVLFPVEAPFLKSHGVSESCSLWDIGCGDGSWLHLFRSSFPNSTITALDHKAAGDNAVKDHTVSTLQDKRARKCGTSPGRFCKVSREIA